jgi:hypothetical protein
MGDRRACLDERCDRPLDEFSGRKVVPSRVEPVDRVFLVRLHEVIDLVEYGLIAHGVDRFAQLRRGVF